MFNKLSTEPHPGNAILQTPPLRHSTNKRQQGNKTITTADTTWFLSPLTYYKFTSLAGDEVKLASAGLGHFSSA